MTNLHFHNFGHNSDVRADKFYSKLLDAKYDGSGAIDSWVKAPKKLRADDNVRLAAYAGETDSLWTGFNWVPVFTYRKGKKLFVRLPQYGETEL